MPRRRRWPEPLPPRSIELRFGRELERLFNFTSRKLRERIVESTELERITAARRAERNLQDATHRRIDADELDDALESVRIEVFEEHSEPVLRDMVERYGLEVTEHNLGQFRRQFKAAIGVDVVGHAPNGPAILRAYSNDNVDLIRTVERQKIDRVREVVSRGWRVGDRWETISGRLEHEFGLDKSKATRIARDQVGKLNGEFARDRQLGAGVDRFIWRTSKDGRVRSLHRSLRGKVFTWKIGHPTERFPGWPIQCRCHAEPVFDDPEELELAGGSGIAGGDPDLEPFPEGIGFARTSGGPRPRPRTGRGPVVPPLGATPEAADMSEEARRARREAWLDAVEAWAESLARLRSTLDRELDRDVGDGPSLEDLEQRLQGIENRAALLRDEATRVRGAPARIVTRLEVEPREVRSMFMRLRRRRLP